MSFTRTRVTVHAYACGRIQEAGKPVTRTVPHQSGAVSLYNSSQPVLFWLAATIHKKANGSIAPSRMNSLIIGTADKTEQLLEHARAGFLLITDGELVQPFLSKFPRAKIFDPSEHSFNPLRGLDYKRARDFAATVYSASPEGKDTLTVRNGKRELTKALLANPTQLDRLKSSNEEVNATIDDLLLSPVLKRVLCHPTNFSFKGSVIAVLNRAELGDFDAFILASLLLGQKSKGQIVLEDFGFYGRPLHVSLIRQDRLVAGVNYLAELELTLQRAVMGIKDKTPCNAVAEDAERLAMYAGLVPNTTGHTEFTQRAMGA